jgi:hypothetical protein
MAARKSEGKPAAERARATSQALAKRATRLEPPVAFPGTLDGNRNAEWEVEVERRMWDRIDRFVDRFEGRLGEVERFVVQQQAAADERKSLGQQANERRDSAIKKWGLAAAIVFGLAGLIVSSLNRWAPTSTSQPRAPVVQKP